MQNFKVSPPRQPETSGGFSEKAGGQQKNVAEILKILSSGSFDEQRKTVIERCSSSMALGYLAAFHPDSVIRATARAFISNPHALAMVAKSTDYPDSAKAAFTTLGNVFGALDGHELLYFAMHAPNRDLREDAVALLEKSLSEGNAIEYGEKAGTFEGTFGRKNAPERVAVIATPEQLETFMLAIALRKEKGDGAEKKGFSEEMFSDILLRGQATL